MALASISFVSCKEKKQSTTTSKKDSEPVVFKTATVPELTDFSYTLTDSGEGVLITKYLGTSDSVRIPSEIEGIPTDELLKNIPLGKMGEKTQYKGYTWQRYLA